MSRAKSVDSIYANDIEFYVFLRWVRWMNAKWSVCVVFCTILLAGMASVHAQPTGHAMEKNATPPEILFGIWPDYGACLTRGNVSSSVWTEERMKYLRELKMLGFNVLFLPPRRIELYLAFQAGWKPQDIVLLVSPSVSEGMASYTAYMSLVAFIVKECGTFRGVYTDEPADFQNQWLQEEEGKSRMQLLCELLHTHDMPLFFSGYAYMNGNGALAGADYEYEGRSPFDTPLSHNGIIDGEEYFREMFRQYGVQSIVLDDTYSYSMKTPLPYRCDQRPVHRAFAQAIAAEMRRNASCAGGGVLLNLSYDPGTFDPVAPCDGDPAQYISLMEEFLRSKDKNTAYRYLVVYSSDTPSEIALRLFRAHREKALLKTSETIPTGSRYTPSELNAELGLYTRECAVRLAIAGSSPDQEALFEACLKYEYDLADVWDDVAPFFENSALFRSLVCKAYNARLRSVVTAARQTGILPPP